MEGKSDLFYYEDGNLRRFFYNIEDQDTIRQLIYKSYYVDNHNIAKNKAYQEQLKTELSCSSISESRIMNVEYKKADLVQFFTDYNDCAGQDVITYEKSRKNDFNLNIRPGLNFSSFSFSFKDDIYQMENKMNFRAGLELEYVFPFNRNKWSVFIEPTYQSYEDGLTYTQYPGTVFEKESTVNVNYSSIEVPLGLRYYMFTSTNSKFFVDISYIFDFPNSVLLN